MIMTNDERDNYIRNTHDAIVRILPVVDDLKKTVYGNGTPGIKQQLAILAEREENCPAKEAYEERWDDANNKRGSRLLTVAIISLAVGIISTITSVCVAVWK